MIVLVNDATKFSDILMNHDKVYFVNLELGYETDTLDFTGKITKKYEKNINFSKEEIIKIINSFKGNIKQIPPMYSAIKKDGIKLYDLARKNIELELEARNVCIYEISDINIKNKNISFRVKVSKGTYIRSLVRDIGRNLGCFATMTGLIREQINNFSINDVGKKISLNDLMNFKKLEVSEKEYIFLKNGMTKIFYNLHTNEKYLKVFFENEFKGIAEVIKKESENYYLKRSFYFK